MHHSPLPPLRLNTHGPWPSKFPHHTPDWARMARNHEICTRGTGAKRTNAGFTRCKGCPRRIQHQHVHALRIPDAWREVHTPPRRRLAMSTEEPPACESDGILQLFPSFPPETTSLPAPLPRLLPSLHSRVDQQRAFRGFTGLAFKVCTENKHNILTSHSSDYVINRPGVSHRSHLSHKPSSPPPPQPKQTVQLCVSRTVSTLHKQRVDLQNCCIRRPQAPCVHQHEVPFASSPPPCPNPLHILPASSRFHLLRPSVKPWTP